MSRRERTSLDRWPRAGAKVYGLGDPTRTSRDVLEQQGNDVSPSCRDCEEGGQEQGLLDEADDLIGEAGGPAELADRLQGAEGGECARDHGNLSFLQKDPLPAQARWPPPSVARLSWRCQDPLLCVPQLLGVCPSREEIFQKGSSK